MIFCIIFSPTSLLALERGNLDLHLFLIAFLISYNRFFYINLFLISFSFLLKYYPITFFINLFTEKKKSKKFILILFILSLFLSSLFIFYHYWLDNKMILNLPVDLFMNKNFYCPSSSLLFLRSSSICFLIFEIPFFHNLMTNQENPINKKTNKRALSAELDMYMSKKS